MGFDSYCNNNIYNFNKLTTMDINISGHKVETETPFLRKQETQPKEETIRFTLFVVGIVLGAIVTFIVTSGGIH